MFDQKANTYWHGSVSQTSQIVINFKSPITFHKLEFIARPEAIAKQDRYRDVCLYLNDVKTDACTAGDKITESGETIVLEKQMDNVKNVEVRFVHYPAAVAELNIFYQPASESSKYNSIIFVNISLQDLIQKDYGDQSVTMFNFSMQRNNYRKDVSKLVNAVSS